MAEFSGRNSTILALTDDSPSYLLGICSAAGEWVYSQCTPHGRGSGGSSLSTLRILLHLEWSQIERRIDMTLEP